ncbi:MAG: rubredoxin [Aeromicrobium sp.]|uniref:rubredoxin n=1 Tax=Aeromicrobium sp. TaxID=1871063 RepID=UPI0025C41FC9|nr:rubredoxin [Aeromicrobium sp.]MCK5890078.1 rubredoxin [Aeromicrobium sp.]MDF1706349.1 rubredoxin [Aeromicrobium sp.]
MAKFICPNCEFVYDEAAGIPREGWPAGTPFDEVDPDWTCPDCGVREQVDFLPIEEFVRNDQDGNVISQETREQALARQRAELQRERDEENA